MTHRCAYAFISPRVSGRLRRFPAGMSVGSEGKGRASRGGGKARGVEREGVGGRSDRRGWAVYQAHRRKQRMIKSGREGVLTRAVGTHRRKRRS